MKNITLVILVMASFFTVACGSTGSNNENDTPPAIENNPEVADGSFHLVVEGLQSAKLSIAEEESTSPISVSFTLVDDAEAETEYTDESPQTEYSVDPGTYCVKDVKACHSVADFCQMQTEGECLEFEVIVGEESTAVAISLSESDADDDSDDSDDSSDDDSDDDDDSDQGDLPQIVITLGDYDWDGVSDADELTNGTSPIDACDPDPEDPMCESSDTDDEEEDEDDDTETSTWNPNAYKAWDRDLGDDEEPGYTIDEDERLTIFADKGENMSDLQLQKKQPIQVCNGETWQLDFQVKMKSDGTSNNKSGNIVFAVETSSWESIAYYKVFLPEGQGWQTGTKEFLVSNLDSECEYVTPKGLFGEIDGAFLVFKHFSVDLTE